MLYLSNKERFRCVVALKICLTRTEGRAGAERSTYPSYHFLTTVKQREWRRGDERKSHDLNRMSSANIGSEDT